MGSMEKKLLLYQSTQNSPKTQSLWRSCRGTIALMSFLAILIIFVIRVNLSVAIVAMVKMNSTRDVDDVIRDEAEYNANRSTYITIGEFDWSPSLQGFILSSFFYGYVVAQIPAGYLAQRYGGKWIIGLALLIMSLLTLLTPIATRESVVLLIAIRILIGLSQEMCAKRYPYGTFRKLSVVFPAFHATWALWAPKWERTRLISIASSGDSVGMVVSLSLTGYLSSSSFLGGWPAAFYLYGICGCILFVLWCFVVYDSPSKHPRISKEELTYIQSSAKNAKHKHRMPWLRVATSMPMWAIVVVFWCHHWGFFTMLTYLPTYLSHILHFDLAKNGTLSSVPYLGLFVITTLTSILSDYVRRHKYLSTKNMRKICIFVGLSVPAVLMFSVGYAGDNTTLALTLVILSITLTGISNAGFMPNIVDTAPLYAGTLMGIANTFAATSGLVAPQVVGQLIGHNDTGTQWQYVFSIAAAINVFGALFYIVFGDGEEQWWAKDAETDTSQKS